MCSVFYLLKAHYRQNIFCFLCFPFFCSKIILWNLQFLFSLSHHWVERVSQDPQFSHSVMSDFLQPHGLQHAWLPCPSPSPRAYQTHVHRSMMPSNHLILCYPLFLPPSIFPSIRVFSNESVLRIRWQKHWSFSFSNSLSNEYSGLISFRMDWFDLAFLGTLKSLLQRHNCRSMWDLVPQSGTEPGFPALEAQSLSRWTIRDTPWGFFFSSTLWQLCVAHCGTWDTKVNHTLFPNLGS